MEVGTFFWLAVGAIIIVAVLILVGMETLYRKHVWRGVPGIKSPGPLAISRQAYEIANTYFPQKKSHSTSEPLPEDAEAICMHYLDEGTNIAQAMDVLKYDGSGFPVSEMVARMLLAYDKQVEMDGYPMELHRSNVEIGTIDLSQAQTRREKILDKNRDQIGNQPENWATKLVFGTISDSIRKETLEGIIQDMNLGQFVDELKVLTKKLHYNEVAYDYIINIHSYFKGLQFATLRKVKEEFTK
jgi:hypothetical protein